MGIIGSEKSQLDKFKELARELAADEDESHWDERLRRLATKKPDRPPPSGSSGT